MKVITDFDETPPFELARPSTQSVPFVFNSPHSGTDYPQSFLESSKLNDDAIRRSEDSFVDELFESAVNAGAPLLRARFPRAFLDVNREPYELDPGMFTEDLPRYANIRSPRVASGLGTIARIVAERQEIYTERMPITEAFERIEKIYKPYHALLRRTLAETHVAFGHAILVDCHSMPSAIRGQDRWRRPDFVIGDRYGTSCHGPLADAAAEILRGMGYSVARNRPYAGGFITEHYGRPAKGLHAFQIEINRALYMDEKRYEKSVGWRRLQANLSVFARTLFGLSLDGLVPLPQAAE